jgi:pilus assembly protein CpaD
MPSATSTMWIRRSRAAATGASLALLAALSAGCSTVGTSDVNLADYDHHKRHPIMISEEPEVLNIPVGMNGPAVSPEIERAIRDYVDEYRENGTGVITIQVPTASANENAAAATGRAAHYALVNAGVPHSLIQVAPYYVGDHAKTATLRLSYLRVKAVTPRCGVWAERHPNRLDNAQYHNFGCASQQNLAAMVANPADFVRPRPVAPANGQRRAAVIRTYAEKGNTGWDPAPETGLIEGDIGGSE